MSTSGRRDGAADRRPRLAIPPTAAGWPAGNDFTPTTTAALADGIYRDGVAASFHGTLRYRVCKPGTSVCSPEASITL